MKKYEIWTTFEDGTEVYLERHKSLKEAEATVNIYNRQNQYDLKMGYGFPHGVPTYIIKAGA